MIQQFEWLGFYNIRKQFKANGSGLADLGGQTNIVWAVRTSKSRREWVGLLWRMRNNLTKTIR